MLSKIIVCISARQATIGRWRAGKLIDCDAYGNDETGYTQFREFIAKHHDIPVHLIVDVVEEDYRTETIPHTRGQARRELLQRKLSQIYRNTLYRTAQFIGRESSKRRDDRMLLIALTNPDILTPWLTILEETQAPLAGAYMLPMAGQLLIKQLKFKQPHLLLTTRESAGFRQTFFSDQQLRLSRINPAIDLDERQIESLYLSETEKTKLYLISLRLITRETPLHLVFPSITPIKPVLIKQLEDQQGGSADIIPVELLANKIGLNVELLKQYPDLVYMQALAKGQISNNLLPDARTKNFQLYQLKTVINLTSIIIIGITSLFAANSLLNINSIKQQIATATQQTKLQEDQYLRVSKNFPKTPVPGEDLKIAVELAQKFDSLGKTPKRLMTVISQALDKQPELQLNRLRWKQTEDAKFTDTLPGNKQVKAPPPGQPNPVPPLPQNGLYELGFIDGEIRNFNGDYRAALESVEQLATNLRQNKDVAQISTTLLPFNTSSQTVLQGSTLDQQSLQQETATFQIKIILKPETDSPLPRSSQLHQVKP